MKRKTKIVFLSIVAVIVVITGGIAGGKYYMDKKEELKAIMEHPEYMLIAENKTL